jgi:hypothetical protein
MHDDFEKVNASEVVCRFSFSVNCWKPFCDNIVVRKEQGARAENRGKSWLKQLRIAVSTEASLPVGSSPQNSKTNFVDLSDDGWNFQKLTKISPKSMPDRNTRTVSLVNPPSSFHAKRQGGGGWRFFKKKMYSLSYSHKNFGIVHQQLQQLVQKLELKLHDMSWFTNVVFGNIASISDVRRAC